jgi:mannose-6-phosphate isomerase-like protein (cupin superfamily)
MDYFEIVSLSKGETRTLDRFGVKEKLIVGNGECVIYRGGNAVKAKPGTNLDLVAASDRFEIGNVTADTVLIRMCGRWGDEIGGSGLFGVAKSPNPSDGGDPVDYPKETNFDSHYHDCDEYWILFEGRGVAVSEGKRYEVEAGDCVVTGMGFHHDFPVVHEPVKAVYFETTIEGRKRRGHLWNHTHGPAQPQDERV